MYIQDYLEDFMSYDEMEEFAEWPKYWNTLHGEVCKISVTSKIREDIPKMVKLWREGNEGRA